MPTNLQHLIAVLKKGKKSPGTSFTPPDPAIEFPHPENFSLFTSLKEDSTVAIPGVTGGYETRTHPDLTSILYDLLPDRAVRRGYAFGRPVMATPTGLVFAYASGTDYVFLKLNEERFDSARQDGGRFDPSHGQDWIEFRVGGRVGSSSEWQSALIRWANISYQDALNIA
jgi:hypothetical protein